MAAKLEAQAVLDALGHGILIFAGDGKLDQHNIMAGTILGRDLNLIKEKGWTVAAELLELGLGATDLRLDAVREQALLSDRPVRFRIFRSGAYVPCAAAAVNGTDGEVYLVLTLDVPDWGIVANVINRFRSEMHDAVDSTVGHIRLINRTLTSDADDAAAKKVAKRIGGFTRLIEIHMSRAGRLVTMLDRLQDIRMGDMREKVRKTLRKISLEDYIEDFIEELDETHFLDPESETHDYRSRIKTQLEDGLAVHASPPYLTLALREVLRNAIMYSMVGTPITIKAQKRSKVVQFDIIDEGYGIREKERERVFEVFQRARQPQIIGEFGYGLALHLSKYEIEAMNGRMWFTGEENVGTTLHLQLPAWEDETVPSSSDKQA